MTHPEWAIRHKKPGTGLRNIKGRYYLYKVVRSDVAGNVMVKFHPPKTSG